MRNRIRAAYARAVLFIIRPVLDELQRVKEEHWKREAIQVAERAAIRRGSLERTLDAFANVKDR